MGRLEDVGMLTEQSGIMESLPAVLFETGTVLPLLERCCPLSLSHTSGCFFTIDDTPEISRILQRRHMHELSKLRVRQTRYVLDFRLSLLLP